MTRFRNRPYSSEDSSGLNLATIHLTPSQHAVASQLLDDVRQGGVRWFRGATGIGKSTILTWLAGRVKGTLVSVRRFARAMRAPAGSSDLHFAVHEIEHAFAQDRVVLVDDIHVLASSDGARWLVQEAGQRRITLLLTSASEMVLDAAAPADRVRELHSLKAYDFEWLCRQYLGESARRIDFRKVLRAYPALNGHQLKGACLWLGLRDAEPDTEALLDYLATH